MTKKCSQKKCSPQKIPMTVEIQPHIQLCVDKPHVKVKNNAETGKLTEKKPTFQHQEADGTSIKEYKEGGKATEVIVESSFGTRYELSTPDDAASPKIRDQNVNRVPTIRMPF